MSTVEFKSILSKIKGHTKSIYLHVKGEPLIHPDFELIVQSAYEEGFTVNITTNGKLLNRYGAFFTETGMVRQINVSLHSHADGEKVAGEEYINELVKFLALAKGKIPPYISLRLWNLAEYNGMNENKENRVILKALEEYFGIDYHLDKQKVIGKGIRLSENVFLNFQSLFQWPDSEGEYFQSEGKCRGMTDHIAVLVDGTVVPCCLDNDGEIALGNLFTDDLEEILNSHRVKTMINGFSTGVCVERLCAKCSYKERFGK